MAVVVVGRVLYSRSSSMCSFISGEVDGLVGGFMLVSMVGLIPLVEQ